MCPTRTHRLPSLSREVLRKSQALFEKLFESSPDSILVTGPEGRIARVNAQAEKLFGYSRDELLGQPVELLVPERFRDAHSGHRRDYDSVPHARPMSAGLELYGRRKDGSEFPVDIMLSPLKDEKGGLVLAVVRDITARKAAEEALRDSQALLGQLFESSPDAILLLTSLEGRIVRVNTQTEKMSGYRRDELIGQSLEILVAERSRDPGWPGRETYRAEARKEAADAMLQLYARRKNGDEFPVEVALSPVETRDGEFVLAVVRDVTNRKRAEEALRQREQQLQAILDNSTAVIYLKDVAGHYIRINRQFETLFRVRRNEIVGKTDHDLFPSDMADKFRANDEKVLQACAPLEFEEVAPQDDGLHTYISIKFPLFDSTGKPYAVAGISTDITERKRAEEGLLSEVTSVLLSNLDVRRLLAAISASIRQVRPHSYACLALYDPDIKKLRLRILAVPAEKEASQEEALLPLEGSPAGWAFTSREPLLLNRMETDRFTPEVMQPWIDLGVQSACWLPLTSHGRVLGTLIVASDREADFAEKDVKLLSQVANRVAVALDNALAFQQIANLKEKLAEEKLYLEEELRTEYNFDEIVGVNAGLKRILKQVETVAPTDATVLILGETGTGKELIARAIHNLSLRRERTFIRLSCAAIPSGLLESELFGHEKGAFTGAISQKIGRLELAHQGTLFLDEVGDIPLELQPKLLRALQEKEFERLGSTRTIPVDVRLIAATNRDLAKMMKDGQFRGDLYYRLNVFPITVPPLRERPGDIPILVRYFTQKHAQRMNRKIESIPAETMSALSRWHWPGNIRELENLIERAVILSQGPTLHVPLAELKPSAETASATSLTLEAQEREHILRVLREAKGVIGGPNGAATLLGLKRTTLNSKMQRLGISRSDL